MCATNKTNVSTGMKILVPTFWSRSNAETIIAKQTAKCKYKINSH